MEFWLNEDFFVKENQAGDRFKKLDVFKSVDGLHTRMLGELTGVNARKFLIVFERLWKTGEGFWICEGRK